MAFRTDGLAKAYAAGQQEAIRLQSFATSHNNALAAGNVSANLVQQIMGQMKGSIEIFDVVSATSGMQQYARDQQDDQAYDVVAEFLAMRNASVAVRDWVINNFPTVGGFIQKDTYETDGSITVRVFTSIETAGLQTVLTTLVGTIG